ncbi:MAG: RNA polymerase sigma factor [Pseudomonadota bacterium]
MSTFRGIEIDEVTLRRAQKGDRRAMSEICRRFAPAVLTLCFRITGDRSLADDLTQETFVEVIRGLQHFRAESSLATWIRHIAVSRCLMHRRQAWSRRVSALPEPTDVADATNLAASHAVEHDLAAALQALPEVQRTVVWLHDVEGWTHKEIAAATGRSVSFSKSSLSRARAALRAWHEQIEESSPRALRPVAS